MIRTAESPSRRSFITTHTPSLPPVEKYPVLSAAVLSIGVGERGLQWRWWLPFCPQAPNKQVPFPLLCLKWRGARSAAARLQATGHQHRSLLICLCLAWEASFTSQASYPVLSWPLPRNGRSGRTRSAKNTSPCGSWRCEWGSHLPHEDWKPLCSGPHL